MVNLKLAISIIYSVLQCATYTALTGATENHIDDTLHPKNFQPFSENQPNAGKLKRLRNTGSNATVASISGPPISPYILQLKNSEKNIEDRREKKIPRLAETPNANVERTIFADSTLTTENAEDHTNNILIPSHSNIENIKKNIKLRENIGIANSGTDKTNVSREKGINIGKTDEADATKVPTSTFLNFIVKPHKIELKPNFGKVVRERGEGKGIVTKDTVELSAESGEKDGVVELGENQRLNRVHSKKKKVNEIVKEKVEKKTKGKEIKERGLSAVHRSGLSNILVPMVGAATVGNHASVMVGPIMLGGIVYAMGAASGIAAHNKNNIEEIMNYFTTITTNSTHTELSESPSSAGDEELETNKSGQLDGNNTVSTVSDESQIKVSESGSEQDGTSTSTSNIQNNAKSEPPTEPEPEPVPEPELETSTEQPNQNKVISHVTKSVASSSSSNEGSANKSNSSSNSNNATQEPNSNNNSTEIENDNATSVTSVTNGVESSAVSQNADSDDISESSEDNAPSPISAGITPGLNDLALIAALGIIAPTTSGTMLGIYGIVSAVGTKIIQNNTIIQNINAEMIKLKNEVFTLPSTTSTTEDFSDTEPKEESAGSSIEEENLSNKKTISDNNSTEIENNIVTSVTSVTNVTSDVTITESSADSQNVDLADISESSDDNAPSPISAGITPGLKDMALIATLGIIQPSISSPLLSIYNIGNVAGTKIIEDNTIIQNINAKMIKAANEVFTLPSTTSTTEDFSGTEHEEESEESPIEEETQSNEKPSSEHDSESSEATDLKNEDVDVEDSDDDSESIQNQTGASTSSSSTSSKSSSTSSQSNSSTDLSSSNVSTKPLTDLSSSASTSSSLTSSKSPSTSSQSSSKNNKNNALSSIVSLFRELNSYRGKIGLQPFNHLNIGYNYPHCYNYEEMIKKNRVTVKGMIATVSSKSPNLKDNFIKIFAMDTDIWKDQVPINFKNLTQKEANAISVHQPAKGVSAMCYEFICGKEDKTFYVTCEFRGGVNFNSPNPYTKEQWAILSDKAKKSQKSQQSDSVPTRVPSAAFLMAVFLWKVAF